MKLPKNFFVNLSADRYRQYLKLLPDMHNEKTQAYTMLAFTLAALSFFGIFAINPTLSTITDLKKQLADSTFVHQQLTVKIQNLTVLQGKYNSMAADLPLVFNAIPEKPQVPQFVGEVEGLLSQSNLQVKSLRTNEVELTPTKPKTSNLISSFSFSLEAEGQYEDMLSFVQSLVHLDRMVTVEQFSISKDSKRDVLLLNLRGREYFKPQ